MKLVELAFALWLIAFLISLHQYANYGSWFESKDVHHEVFIASFGFGGVILYWFAKRRTKT